MRNCRCFFDIFSLFFSLGRLEYAANACFAAFIRCKVPAKLVFSFIKTTFCQLRSACKAGDWTNVSAEIVEQWVEGTKKLHQPMSWCSVLLEVQNCTRREQGYFLSQLFFVATTLFAAATLLFVAFLFAVVHATLLARFLVFLLAALFVFFLAALLVVFFAASFLFVSLLHVLCSSIETESEERQRMQGI